MRFCRSLSLIAAISLVSVLFFGYVSVSAAAATTDAMQFRYNAQHTGDYSSATGSMQPNGKLLWKFTTGGQAESPAIANGIVYVGSRKDITNNGVLTAVTIYIHAINAANGAVVWHVEMGTFGPSLDSSISTPAVVNGVVYVGLNDFVYALNAATGDVRWSHATAGRVYSSPAVVNGVVYVGGNDTVYALDANTGIQLWSYKTSGSIRSSPTVDDGVVYINSDGPLISNRTYSEGLATVIERKYLGEIYALWADTGKEYWNYTFRDSIGVGWSSPAVVNGIVYVGSADHNIYALAHGDKLWNYTTGGKITSSPAVVNGVVFVGSNDWNYYAINSATGVKLWSYIIGNNTNGCTSGSSPAVANGVVYITAGNGDLNAIDAGTGTLKWLYNTGYNMSTSCPVMAPSPAIADGVVYICSYNGNIYAIGNSNAGQSGISVPGFEVIPVAIALAIATFVVRKKR